MRCGQFDQIVRPGERFCEALSSYRVDTRPGRRSDCFMPRLAELLYNLRTDQPGTSNYDDLHWLVFPNRMRRALAVPLRLGPAMEGGGPESCATRYRSEARRVGKECVRTCSCRWSPSRSKKK